MSVNDTAHPENSAWNKQVYHRLKLSLSLGLRRQIFIAVCDDLNLRNQVAARLHSTLAYPVGQILNQPENIYEASTPAYPRLVTLRLNMSDPHPIAQINQWLTNYPPPVVGKTVDTPGRALPVPAFQIVGVEQLTRQPVASQRLFLQYLRTCEQTLISPEGARVLDSSILLWVPRPWLYAIQQSAPQFWRCRTGMFVFAGEPTPMAQGRGTPERFSGTRGIDLGDFDQSAAVKHRDMLEEVILPKDVESEIAGDEDFDFPAETVVEENHLGSNADSSEKSDILAVDFVPEEPHTQEKPAEITANINANPNSGSSYSSQVTKELTELILATLDTAIAVADETDESPQQMLAEIEVLHANKASGEVLAEAYQVLGNFYRQQIEQGHATLEHLMVAIIAYQEAITLDETSPYVPDILNDLGTLYWMLYRTPPNSEEGQSYIEQGIEFYQLALKLISSQTHPETYARVQNNLGTAFGDLAKFNNPAENWQNAISAYTEALRYRTAEMEPLKYAACQNNLGTAYWHLAQYNQPVEHLKKAIASYNLALVHYTPQQEPLKYGMIQNNIGTAYWNLAQYEQPPQNLQKAIDAYREALKYRTPATLPAACAATQNNLGTAFWHLANQIQTKKEERHHLLEKCIISYQDALELAHSLNGMALSFDLFATHNNLGLAHYQLVTDSYFEGDKSDRTYHLEASLDNHLQALTGLGKQPDVYQATITYIVKTVRAFHSELGIQGQNLALSKVPGQLLPEILPKI